MSGSEDRICWTVKKFCSTEGMKVYSTMSETTAAFAERTTPSFNSFLYRYMEDYGYKYFHKLPHFIVTMNSRNNRSINMKPNDIMNSDFMSIIYSKPLRENENLKFGLEERVRNSEYDLPFRKCYRPHHTLHQKFLKLLPLLLKNLQHIQSKTNKKKFYEKEKIRVI